MWDLSSSSGRWLAPQSPSPLPFSRGGMPVGRSPKQGKNNYCGRSRNTVKQSVNSVPMRHVSVRLRKVSWTLLGAALAMTILLILSASGCCAGHSLTAPVLPVGKPKKETTEMIAHEVMRHMPLPPADGGPLPPKVTLPRSLIIRIFGHLDEWRAWALALEEAGRWRGTGD